jgi:hypothetical protein
MPTVIDTRLSQPHRVHGSSFAADERRVRRLGALIFAELLPCSTVGIATASSSFRPQSSSGDPEWLQPGRVLLPSDTATRNPLTPIARAGKEISSMKAYRTESSYYFSSRQLLPAGALVFFSDKHRRYIHPTAGTLLDPHPRLQSLSDAESQELEEHWHEALSRF